jgi:hypothetical protein
MLMHGLLQEFDADLRGPYAGTVSSRYLRQADLVSLVSRGSEGSRMREDAGWLGKWPWRQLEIRLRSA